MFTHADQVKLASKRIRQMYSGAISQNASYEILAALCGKDSAHEMRQSLKKGPVAYPEKIHEKASSYLGQTWSWMDIAEMHAIAKPFTQNPYAKNEIPAWACIATSGLALEAIQKLGYDVVVFHSSGPGLLGAYNAVSQGMESRLNPERIAFVDTDGVIPARIGDHQRIVHPHDELHRSIQEDEISISWNVDYTGSTMMQWEHKPRIVFLQTDDAIDTIRRQYDNVRIEIDVESIRASHAFIHIERTPEGLFAKIDPKVHGSLSFEFYDQDEGARDQTIRIYGDVSPTDVVFLGR